MFILLKMSVNVLAIFPFTVQGHSTNTSAAYEKHDVFSVTPNFQAVCTWFLHTTLLRARVIKSDELKEPVASHACPECMSSEMYLQRVF